MQSATHVGHDSNGFVEKVEDPERILDLLEIATLTHGKVEVTTAGRPTYTSFFVDCELDGADFLSDQSHITIAPLIAKNLFVRLKVKQRAKIKFYMSTMEYCAEVTCLGQVVSECKNVRLSYPTVLWKREVRSEPRTNLTGVKDMNGLLIHGGEVRSIELIDASESGLSYCYVDNIKPVPVEAQAHVMIVLCAKKVPVAVKGSILTAVDTLHKKTRQPIQRISMQLLPECRATMLKFLDFY